ncbi:MAG TPA: hypothetical protein VFC46_10780 [Humisphaera sp.]|nr:hypothetical protein [Humisphaera sp.]
MSAGWQFVSGEDSGIPRKSGPEDGVAKIDYFPKLGSADLRNHGDDSISNDCRVKSGTEESSGRWNRSAATV